VRILTKPPLWAVTLPALFWVPNLASAYYDPGVQRWINRDPVADEAGLLGGPAHGSRFPTWYLRQQGMQNTYRFAHNAPAVLVDSDGRFVIVIGAGNGVGVAIGQGVAIGLAVWYVI